jgi:uncharacterized membrane protein
MKRSRIFRQNDPNEKTSLESFGNQNSWSDTTSTAFRAQKLGIHLAITKFRKSNQQTWRFVMESIKKFITLGLMVLSFVACSTARKATDASDIEAKIEHQKNLSARTSDKGSSAVER